MWRPLRPRVKRELRRLQSGETAHIVVPTKWEVDEVDRRMRRFDAKLQASETPVEEGDADLADVIELTPRPEFSQGAQRELRVVGSDVDPRQPPSVQARLDRPLTGIRIPNALNGLPKANPKGDIPADEAEIDLSHLAELLEFVLWLVGEYGVLEVSELTQYICYQFEIGTYSDREIGSVLEVVLSDNKERGSN